jgi:hypothetical protein
VSGDDQGARALVGRAATADQDLALRVLARADRLDLVLGQGRVPAEDGLEGVVDGVEQRIDRAVAGRLRGPLLPADRERHRASRVPAVR